MTDPTNNSEDMLKILSRRKLLRDSAITATGVALLPSFLTGCTKDVGHVDPAPVNNGGLGGAQEVSLTPTDLKNAADNLTTMRTLLIEVFELAKQYDDAVFDVLNAPPQSSWTNFIVDVFIDLAAVIASGIAIGLEGPAAVPAIAFVSAFLHEWGLGKDRPGNLEEVYAEFEFGRVAMQEAIEDKLSYLVDPANNYDNLQKAWNDPVVFNDKKYTLKDLASHLFTFGEEYNRLHHAGLLFFEKAIWNLLIMKCCSYYPYYYGTVGPLPTGGLLLWAQREFYPKHKGNYMRAWSVSPGTWRIYFWNLGIGGYPFTDEASRILFKDDTPDHIINPTGLFNRSYVFEQFSIKKYKFDVYSGPDPHELSNVPFQDINESADDWEFTGGIYPQLAEL